MRNLPVIHSPHDDSALNTLNAMREMVIQLSKSMQDLVAKGQLTPAQYAELLKELNGLIAKGNVTMDDLSDQVLKELNRADPTFELLSIPRDRSVSPGKTTFFNIGENLFDGNYLNGILLRADYGTVLKPVFNYDDWEGKIAIIPITPGENYSVSVENANPNSFRAGVDSEANIFTAYPGTSTLNRIVRSGQEGGLSFAFTAKENEHYLYIQVSSDARELPLQVVVGETIEKSYIPPLGPGEVLPEQTTFFELNGKNLFKGDYFEATLYYATRTGVGEVLYPRTNSSGGWNGRVAVVPIEPNTEYAVHVHDALDASDSGIFSIALTDKYPTFQNANDKYADDFVIREITEDKRAVFTSGDASKYALVQVSNNGQEPRLMFEQGNNYSNYEPGKYIPAKYLDTKISTNGGPSAQDDGQKGRFNIPGNFNDYYAEPALTGFYDNPNTLTPTQYHNKFQALIDRHPEIASYKKVGEDDFGLPLYLYEIKPLDYVYATYYNQNPGSDGDKMPHPKVFLLSGIHGREKSVSYSLYHMFEAILDNPQNLEALDAIKMHMHIQALPIGSPNGFIDNSYSNRNGVNVSRDFPPDGDLTQGESKTIFKVINDNKDMDFFIDFHNMRGRHELIGYSLTDNDFFKESTLQMYRAVGRHWQKTDSRFPQALNHRWAYTGWVNPGTIEWYTEHVLGIPTTLLEIPFENQFVSEPNNGPVLVQLGVDMLMNTLFSIIRYKQ